MGKSSGFRALAGICGLLAVLLAALATVQYRWSTRVAAADVQREKEHLDSAASLYASEFNTAVAQAVGFVQSGARGAVPRLFRELYQVTLPAHGAPEARRLMPDGTFAPAPLPEWIATPGCAAFAIEDPPALVVPIYDVATSENRGPEGIRIMRRLSRQPDRCFVARIDRGYLRDTLIPELIRRSFGETAAGEYDFAVVSRTRPQDVLYGTRERADLKKPFFAIQPFRQLPAENEPGSEHGRTVFVQHTETIVKGSATLAGLFGPGMWELQVARKGMPLAAAFEQTRRRDLLLSLAVEALLMAAILFLVIGVRRTERLAEQKMRFVAGVSHELRAPVSAIAMLSRNQADGLVAGERVKQYGELIHQQSRRLNEMVEQALQYAGIHSGLGRPARDQVDVRVLVEEAVEARRAELARDGIEVEMALSPDLPPAPGDAKLLRIALDNLLSNAQKHAGGGHWIRVSAEHCAPEKEIRISVEDRGAGIDPAEQAGIFEPFCRGRAAIEAQVPGSGLGLSLVRSAAEAHRGSVTLVSEPGRGSTFTMRLPV